MIIALVIGNVVSTEKHPHYRGKKVLIVQPLAPDEKQEGLPARGARLTPRGKSFLAVDGVQAGVGDRVLVVDEGGSARLAVSDEAAMTIRAAVCGIVDHVDIEYAEEGTAAPEKPAASAKPAADEPRRRT
jgi:ethanolamine utilization protein EutN